MRVKKSYLVVASILALCAIVTAASFGTAAHSDEQQQIRFLTDFYKDYLSRPRTGTDARLAPGSFYSKRAEALIATNDALCSTLSRGDDICGYGADGDVFLNSQEIAADLTFETAQFNAVRSGKNTVDVSFTVLPTETADPRRKLRYALVFEQSGWRVDDVYFEEDGAFPARRSMRYEINAENQRVLDQASRLSEVLDWIFIYLSRTDTLDRVDRSIIFPVQICDRLSGCHPVAKLDPRLRQTLGALHRAYYDINSDDTTRLKKFIPTESGPAVEGSTVRVDALELTFKGKAGWSTSIDLNALGRSIPIH